MNKLRKLTKYTLIAAGIVFVSSFIVGANEVKAEEQIALPPGMVAVATQDGGTIVIPIEVQEKLLWETYTENMKNTDLLALRAQSDDEHWNAYLNSLPKEVCVEVVKEYKAQGGQGSDEYLPVVKAPKEENEEIKTEDKKADENAEAKVDEIEADEADTDEIDADEADTDESEEVQYDIDDEAIDVSNSDISADDINEKIRNLTKKLEKLNASLNEMTSSAEFEEADDSAVIANAQILLDENPEILDSIEVEVTKEDVVEAVKVSEAVEQSLEGLSDEDIQKLKNIVDAGASIMESTKKISSKFEALKAMLEKMNSIK